MFNLRSGAALLGMLLVSQGVQAQEPMPVDWSVLADPEAQHFEDPYRDLTQSQFESLMALARLQIALAGELTEGERTDSQARASKLSQNLHAQGLDPEWILAQRESVAARRQRAALSTNPNLNGEFVELKGYLLVAHDSKGSGMVAYLLPDRGVCMHLPPPVPNRLVRLVMDGPPEQIGPCIAATVRGHLSPEESTTTVPVMDDIVPLWSSWQMDVSDAAMSGMFSGGDNETRARTTL